jgi:hypothetical protein
MDILPIYIILHYIELEFYLILIKNANDEEIMCWMR